MEKITCDYEPSEVKRLRGIAKGDGRSLSSLLRKIGKEYK